MILRASSSLGRRIVASCAFTVGCCAGGALASGLLAAFVAHPALPHEYRFYDRYFLACVSFVALSAGLASMPGGFVSGVVYVGGFTKRIRRRYQRALLCCLGPSLFIGAASAAAHCVGPPVDPDGSGVVLPGVDEIAITWSVVAILGAPLSAFIASRLADLVLGGEVESDAPAASVASVAS